MVVVLMAVGCTDNTSRPDFESRSDTTAVDPDDGHAGAVVGDDPESAIVATVDRLNLYWSEVDQDLAFTYQPVPFDRISVGDDGITCNGVEVTAEEVEDNAFVDANCDEGILVAYDPDYLSAGLARIEATLSHEWGHVVQAQAEDLDLSLDPDGLPIDSELQADCFSGAWAKTEAFSDTEALRTDLASAGDPSDVQVDEEEAHGTAEERIVAFDLGFDDGPDACISELLEQLPG